MTEAIAGLAAPPRPADRGNPMLDPLLERLVELGGTDLLITVGASPTGRVDGDLQSLVEMKLTPAQTEAFVMSLVNEKQKADLLRDRDVDFSINWQNKARLRVNAFYQRGSLAAALRLLPYEIPSPASLGVPPVVMSWAEAHHGLVLVTGATGSGKSTTLAALVAKVNQERPVHIITIEDPIEYVHRHGSAIVEQREIGVDATGFARALRAAMRENPDVILVGEMRDLETIQIAITAAETGHLVLGTLHANDTPQTIDRIVDVFPPEQQSLIKIQLSNALVGILSQQLLPKVGGGRVASHEVLVATPAVRNLIREGKTSQIRNVIQTSGGAGMQTLEKSLNQLVAAGKITRELALARAANPLEIDAVLPGQPAGAGLRGR